MKKSRRFLSICLGMLLLASASGCSAKQTQGTGAVVPTEGARLLYEGSSSPNQAYVESDADVVYYTVAVYQNEENDVIVNADSNSAFFDGLQYVLACDKALSQTDIAVEWTTLMGNPEPTEDDQLVIAQVSISEDGEILSERKINFFRKGMEIIIDNIQK